MAVITPVKEDAMMLLLMFSCDGSFCRSCSLCFKSLYTKKYSAHAKEEPYIHSQRLFQQPPLNEQTDCISYFKAVTE
jgi:hypothetical protein